VAVAGSATFRELYAVDVRGAAQLSRPAVDPTAQRPSCNSDPEAESQGGVPCLRSRVIRGDAEPITLSPPPGGSGIYSLVPQVRFGASGDFVVATSQNDGGLALVAFDPRQLDVPHPLLPSRFGAPETVAATPPPGTYGDECCPGPVVLHENSSGGIDGADVLWATGIPDGTIARGELDGVLPAPAGDEDSDGVQDAVDTCPLTADPGQLDSGSIGPGGAPDGIGDACQCGDADDDGEVLAADVTELRLALASALPVTAPGKCEVAGPTGSCDVLDLVVLRRALLFLDPQIAHVCSAFTSLP
jgi:hypothetical protein